MSAWAEDDSAARIRHGVLLHEAIPGGSCHPPLEPYAMCCIDKSVLEDVLFAAPSATRRDTSSLIRQLLGDCDGPSGMGPPPPRVTLEPSSRAMSRERFHSLRDRAPARGFSRGPSSEGLLPAVAHQQQQHLHQYTHFFQHLQLSLCDLCTGFHGGVTRYANDPLQDPSSSPHSPGLGAGPTEGEPLDIYPVSYRPG